MTETTTRRQTIDFLGFLRTQLSGLQGIPTLCYELIQNADDVKDDEGQPAASRITFDVCDDALYVENDGVFREIDFERMERVSWGNKREEAGTTGAFGVGFISVYQVTDSPEVFSSGRHWTFQPDAPEDDRILEQWVETQFTRFRLPWAYTMSNVRSELRIPPVDMTQLEDFVDEIDRSIEAAALFLKQVTTLEVKRSGRPVRRIETLKDGNAFLVSDDDRTIEWRILQGRYDWGAAQMRSQYGELIEQKRQPIVTIAIPEKPLENGLLYAFLPSETRTGLPFHINADFYPSQDRKRILFEHSFQSEWNNLAIECATTTLAGHIDDLLDLFEPKVFWEFAERVKRASEASTLSSAFVGFWEQLKPQIRVKPTVLTASNKRLSPPQTVFLDTDAQIGAGTVLEIIGIDTVHSELRGRRNLLLETGVRTLRISDVADALDETGLCKRTELAEAPEGLRSEDAWRGLWTALGDLWERAHPSERATAEHRLAISSIAFGSDGALWPPSELFIANEHTQQMFSKLSAAEWLVRKGDDDPIPRHLVPTFGLHEGVNTLRQIEDSLEDLWRDDHYSPQEVYEWLEGYRPDISYDAPMRQRLRSCAMWPTADLQLRPLDGLYLAGDFDDPLGLAQLVNVDVLGGRREFLETALSVPRLDFVTYVRDWVPTVLRKRQLDQESLHRLLKVLAENLGRLQGQSEVQRTLAELPLVWCGDDIFLPARSVYFDSADVRTVLGAGVSIAMLPQDSADAVAALYRWLGVAQSIRPPDLVARIRQLTAQPPSQTSLSAIEAIFGYLSRQSSSWDDTVREQYAPLKRLAWLPGTRRSAKWFDASSVYSVFSSYLFESQGNFLAIDRRLQQTRSGGPFLSYLGVASEPTTDQVVRHLLVMSGRGEAITQEIYVFLTRNARDPEIRQLRGKACLYLIPSSGQGRYFRPDEVFWGEHPFGRYRYRLGPDFGRFRDLLDQLGVKEWPDALDAASVLVDIAAAFGASNLRLTENGDEEQIVTNCWQLLTSSLEDGTIDAQTIRKLLGDKKTIPDSRRILATPQRLFFEDRPGWGAKFELIRNNLTPRVQAAWPAMEAAGVMRLSKAIETELHNCAGQDPHTMMRTRLEERLPLIRRVIEAHRAKGVTDFDLDALTNLEHIRADEIELVRVFSGFGRQERSELEAVDAVHLDGTLYFTAQNSQYPWMGISRELAYVLHPSGELSSLGMELKEILSQTLTDASAALDEYGYPRVQLTSDGIPASDTVDVGDAPIDQPGQGRTDPAESDTGGGPGQPSPPHNGHPAPTGPSGPSLKKPRRKTSKLLSYVYPEDETSVKAESEEKVSKRTRIAELGVQMAMAYERAHGRDPTDMETVQVHHPGYDIKSVDGSGRIRYIEVKTTSGVWDSQNPAQMTRTEFESACEFGERYWLYVVEQVETDQKQLYAIPDPANRVDRYLFDYGWKPASE